MFEEETEVNSEEGDLVALTNGNVNDESQRSDKPDEHKQTAHDHETPIIEQMPEEVSVSKSDRKMCELTPKRCCMYFKVMETPQENQAHNTSDDKSDDDFVIIGENTKYEPMAWRFPRTRTCPKVYCNKYFESRHAAMQHYSKMHAKIDLLCEECNTLISMSGQHNMINHFQRKHPDSPIPMPTVSVANSETGPTTSPTKSSNPAISPSYIDRIIELNKQITHHNTGPSVLKPVRPMPKKDRRSERMRQLNSMRHANVSLFLSGFLRPKSFY